MYRAFVYYDLYGTGAENAVRLNLAPSSDAGAAHELLRQFIGKPGFTGGDVEVKVPGIGWVLEDSVETAVYLHRLHESDRELNQS